ERLTNTGAVVVEALLDDRICRGQSQVPAVEDAVRADEAAQSRGADDHSRRIQLDDLKNALAADDGEVVLVVLALVVGTVLLKKVLGRGDVAADVFQNALQAKRGPRGQHNGGDHADNAGAEQDGGGVLLCGQGLPAYGTSRDRKSTRLNSSHVKISYAVFC